MRIEHPDYRTPMQKRQDAIAEQFGKEPEKFTPEVLKRIANGPIYDVEQHYCPAGKLSLAEAKARESAQIVHGDEKEQGTNA